ncbi:hypothetical protein MUY27_18725 [Mucilaginibacter sp. RS28]|uniref:Periplasmic protein n=1 Tax=Mucilaginibacter straminoryzae TaxID=2932774 RepID=A0A9X1X7C5_9SPHI|nr:hypothetical protein [Mucilaginibacter straminoryzae]MCJ8211760.1 hypothetical protein [Mucilaginibacter straminoryzae]
MKKVTLMLALAFSVATVGSFAADKDKGMKCAPGKSCCKKMTKASAAEKAKCKKMCEAAEKKAA